MDIRERPNRALPSEPLSRRLQRLQFFSLHHRFEVDLHPSILAAPFGGHIAGFRLGLTAFYSLDPSWIDAGSRARPGDGDGSELADT